MQTFFYKYKMIILKFLILLQEGEILISQFLTKCKALDQSLPDADLESQVSSLKEDILSHKNPYVEALLAAS